MPFDHVPNPYRAAYADARYAAALALVQTIDYDLRRGTRHYYDGRGRLIVSLDEAVSAIERGDLVVGGPGGNGRAGGRQ